MPANSYEIIKGPPPLSWKEYKASVSRDWQKLLATAGLNERHFQRFLERHPGLVPSPFGHHRLADHLIAQPEIITIPRRKFPDFMWLAGTSAEVLPTLIEIEHPSKPSRKSTSNELSAQFNQALQQVSSWRALLDDPTNAQLFLRTYGIDEAKRNGRPVHFRYILIYGRRETNPSPEFTAIRATLQRADEQVMTFDRLSLSHDWNYCPTVQRKTSKDAVHYRVLCIPACWTIGPTNARWVASVRGLDAAIRSNPLISSERQEFLISRIPYWKAWAATDSHEPISLAHSE